VIIYHKVPAFVVYASNAWVCACVYWHLGYHLKCGKVRK